MPRDFSERMYLTAREIVEMMGVCRSTFYKQVRPHLVSRP